jgi:hypothetical protein
MPLDTDHCDLTGAELDLAAGGKRMKELQEEIKELQKEVDDSGSSGKGFGGASSLA